MWLALKRAGEDDVGRDRVKQLMRQAGIQGAKRRGKPWRTTTPDPSATRPRDLVERDFSAEAPNRLWLADFTYLRCWEGVVFFSFVIDAYSRRIVGWQFAGHMRTDLVLDALRMALIRRDAGAAARPRARSIIPTTAAQGGFNRWLQHLDRGGVDGQASGVDGGVDGAVADEVAGGAVVAPGGGAGVLA